MIDAAYALSGITQIVGGSLLVLLALFAIAAAVDITSRIASLLDAGSVRGRARRGSRPAAHLDHPIFDIEVRK